MTNYKERQPLKPWDRVEVPEELPGDNREGIYGGMVNDYWSKVTLNGCTYLLDPELAQKLRRPFDVGDTVMCMIGDTSVAGEIVERGGWGEFLVRRCDNGWVIEVPKDNMTRMDNARMTVEELKSKFPTPPEGMFWDLTANINDCGSGEVTFEVCLNVETFNKIGVQVKYSSIVWEAGMSEFEVFEAILRESEDLAEFFPKDVQKFKVAQRIGLEFGELRG